MNATGMCMLLATWCLFPALLGEAWRPSVPTDTTKRLLMALRPRTTTTTTTIPYVGGLLGVTVHLELHETRQRAELSLSGVPVGGRLAGSAAFAADGRTVIMDPELATALRRRLCSVVDVVLSPDGTTVRVRVALPLFGIRTVTLRQVGKVQ